MCKRNKRTGSNTRAGSYIDGAWNRVTVDVVARLDEDIYSYVESKELCEKWMNGFLRILMAEEIVGDDDFLLIFSRLSVHFLYSIARKGITDSTR